MKRTHGLVSLAVLHHVTIGLALLVLLGNCLNPGSDATLAHALQLCAFGFFSVIVRRAWASIDGGSEGMSPGKAQGFLWIPFFNFYWVFPALVSLATQTNAKADAGQNPAGRITRGFGLVIAILFSVTTLTAFIPALAWPHVIIYATYVGFTVTYIWQIRRSAAAFDAQSAPAVREPTMMPTVGVAGIIYGCAAAALLCLTLVENLTMSPEVIEQRLKAKGYNVQISDPGIIREYYVSMKDFASLDDLRIISVSRGSKTVGYAFYTTIKSRDAAELMAQHFKTQALRAGNKVIFSASLEGPPRMDNMPIEAWLASF
jgi:hypothetical protein